MSDDANNVNHTISEGSGKPDPVRETKELVATSQLVVVGRESSFSKEIMDYAIDMAKRMTYEIVALSTAPLSCETFLLSSSRKQICVDFETLAETNAVSFREEAEKQSIPFSHFVKYLEYDDALEDLKGDIGSFEFVVSEEAHDAASGSDETGRTPGRDIFVYSIL